jgi:hypothetical protein
VVRVQAMTPYDRQSGTGETAIKNDAGQRDMLIVAGCVGFGWSMRENARIIAFEGDAW